MSGTEQAAVADVAAGAEEKLSKGALKKQAKQQEKQAKKDAQAAQQAAAAAAASTVVASVEDGMYGDLEVIQSRWKTGRTLVAVSELTGVRAEPVWVRGRVHSVRSKGKGCFMVVRRGAATVQATLFVNETITKEMVKYASKVTVESIVDIFANVVACETQCTQSNVELQVLKMFTVSAAATPLPMQIEDAMRNEQETKDANGDVLATVSQVTRLDNRWLDLRTPANNAMMVMQSRVCEFYREYFLQREFVEIHTPKVTPGVSEGGSEVFRLKYFGRDACLAQSPQLYKQMGAACSDLYRVFEIGPVFRAENSMTHRHLCEFTGLDFEMEIVEHYHEVLSVLGQLFVHIFDRLNEKCGALMAAINKQHPFEPLVYPRDTLVIDFREAVTMLRETGIERGDFDDFSTPEEKLIGKLVKVKYNTDFYIIDRYPLTCRPFYTMPCFDDKRYTNSYDVFLRGEEITSGAQRIHDVELLKRRASECGIPESNISSYVESFKFGVPPHGGAGIGLERVVMLYMGLNNIRKTTMFPRDPTRLTP